MTDLKPCPFCGDDDEKGRQAVTQMPDGNTFDRIKCRCCGAMCPEQNWNQRAASPADQVPAGYRLQPISEFDAYQEVLRDAERYRWIRQCGAEWSDLPVFDSRGHLDGEFLDEAVDTATSATPPAAEGK